MNNYNLSGPAYEPPMRQAPSVHPLHHLNTLYGGRWLINQGIADPSKLAIVGWSYGGYAALQSAAVNPELFG